MKLRLGAVVWVGFLLVATGALAQQPAADDQARTLFSEGSERFAARDFAVAANDFQKAYDLSKRKELLWNIGVCRRELGELEPALDAFRQYLAFAGPTGPNSDKARQQIDDLERLVPAQLEVHSRGKPAQIKIDGVERGTTPVYAGVPAGSHTVVAEGGANDRLELMLKAGERRLVEVGHKSRTGMWVGIGVGAVVVVGVVIAVAVVATRPADLHSGTLDPGVVGIK